MILTPAQRAAVKRVYDRHVAHLSNAPTYRAFRRTVLPEIATDCVMVQASGMWLGIETDGCTHS